jgi:hypothetical protein
MDRIDDDCGPSSIWPIRPVIDGFDSGQRWVRFKSRQRLCAADVLMKEEEAKGRFRLAHPSIRCLLDRLNPFTFDS